MIAYARTLHPAVQVALLVAAAVVLYFAASVVLAIVPLLFAVLISHRVRTGRRGHGLAADLVFAGGGYLLGRGRRRDADHRKPRRITVRGERYETAADARAAAFELLRTATSDVPSETRQWRDLIGHALELERAAWEADRA